jgi:topoisomerase IA-like protein
LYSAVATPITNKPVLINGFALTVYEAYIKKGAKNYKIPEYHEPENLTLKDCEDIIKKGSKTKKKKTK